MHLLYARVRVLVACYSQCTYCMLEFFRMCCILDCLYLLHISVFLYLLHVRVVICVTLFVLVSC